MRGICLSFGLFNYYDYNQNVDYIMFGQWTKGEHQLWSIKKCPWVKTCQNPAILVNTPNSFKIDNPRAVALRKKRPQLF